MRIRLCCCTIAAACSLTGAAAWAQIKDFPMERFAKEGAELVASSPAQFAAHIKSELARWARVVKDSGMRAD